MSRILQQNQCPRSLSQTTVRRLLLTLFFETFFQAVGQTLALKLTRDCQCLLILSQICHILILKNLFGIADTALAGLAYWLVSSSRRLALALISLRILHHSWTKTPIKSILASSTSSLASHEKGSILIIYQDPTRRMPAKKCQCRQTNPKP